MPIKQKHKNHLFLIRKKMGLGQKQVALLLGHKTTDQISRYERGVKLPSLKTALKLGIIYHIPIRILLYDYFEQCLDEIKEQERVAKIGGQAFGSKEFIRNEEIEFCTYAEKLKRLRIPQKDLDEVGSHITRLVQARGEKSGHFTPRK